LAEARRDIKKGEEICYDYASKFSNSATLLTSTATQANDRMNMKCECGSALCRGYIKGDDYKLKRLQEAYGDHWLPFILKKIKENQ
jgi:hypothetical protein